MNLRVNFNWKLALFVVFFLPILTALGNWQLDRAEEKQQIKEAYEVLRNSPAVDYKSLAPEQWQNYKNVSITGMFRKEQWLIDNHIYQGKFGYELIQPFTTESGDIVLVSRGWVAGSLDRTQLPQVDTPSGLININAYLYRPTEAFQLQPESAQHDWPRVLQSANAEKMYKDVGKNDKIDSQFVLRLQHGAPGLLVANWQIMNVEPEKHTAYAMQWFGMALLLVVLFVWASVKRETKHP